MNIAEAMRVVAKEFSFHAGEARHERDSHVSALDEEYTEVDGRRPSVILPFFPVLLLGRDGAWSEVDDRARYHPSVAYARVIYFAIALNWIIDLVGLAYLFYTFLAWSDEPLVRSVVPLFLGMTLSSGLAAFAASLVQKPLRKPTWPRLPTWIYLVGASVVALCTTILVDPDMFAQTTFWPLAWLALAGVLFMAMAAAFGVMEAVFVAARGGMMLVVGYVVAAPLHEAMFQKEIEQYYYESHETRLGNLIANLDRSEKLDEATAIATCIAGATEGVSQTTQDDCTDERLELDRATYLLSVAELVQTEVSGWKNLGDFHRAKQKKWLAEQAKLVDPGAAKYYAIGSLSPSKRSEKAATNLKDAKDRKTTTEIALNACLVAVGETSSNITKISDTCRSVRNSEFSRQKTRLETNLGAYTSRANNPGAIDRALALNHIVHDAAEVGGDRAEDAKAVVDHLLDTAWVLALLMPLVVLTMKVTAGARLEPYLEKRWKSAEERRK